MCALRQRMHARIGATRPVDTHRLTAYAFEGAFEMILNRIAAGLTLPSRKRRSIVSEYQL